MKIRNDICFKVRTNNHFNVPIKQVNNSTLQRKQRRMMKAVTLRERSYKKRCHTGCRRTTKWRDIVMKRLARIERSGSYVVRDWITFRTNEMARAPDVGLHRSSTDSSASGLVKVYQPEHHENMFWNLCVTYLRNAV